MRQKPRDTCRIVWMEPFATACARAVASHYAPTPARSASPASTYGVIVRHVRYQIAIPSGATAASVCAKPSLVSQSDSSNGNDRY